MNDKQSQMIYLNRTQHQLFEIDYMALKEHLVICAKTLLQSNVEYDKIHKDILSSYQNQTILLSRENLFPGWFEIKEAIN